VLKLDNLDLASILIGGAIHDHEHPGFNNVYMVDTSDELAIRYNDQSVLENHHVASAFRLIRTEELDFMRSLEKEDQKLMRKKLIGLVLATDMSKHFSEMGRYKPRIQA
jgi:cAMP-specific phosphodiesterase 4